MIYLPNCISTVFLFLFHFYCIFIISYYLLVNLPMSLGCGDWTAGLFYGDNPYRVVGFWWRDINSAFISTSFGWFFLFFLVMVRLDHACKCFCSDLCLFFLLFLLLLVILFACTTRNSLYAVFIPYFCFLGTWTARHLIIWCMASTWSAISIESKNVISYLEGFFVRMKEFPPARLFLD